MFHSVLASFLCTTTHKPVGVFVGFFFFSFTINLKYIYVPSELAVPQDSKLFGVKHIPCNMVEGQTRLKSRGRFLLTLTQDIYVYLLLKLHK